MSSRLRLFIGIALPDGIRQALAEAYSWMGRYEKSLKIVPPSNYHITLKFFGPVESSALASLKKGLGEAAAGQAAFEVLLVGRGVFPLKGEPDVFWSGVTVSKELSRMAVLVDEATTTLGFSKEKSPYCPHITLAKAGGKRATKEFLKEWSDRAMGFENLRFLTEKITLFESRALPGGVAYPVVQEFNLPA